MEEVKDPPKRSADELFGGASSTAPAPAKTNGSAKGKSADELFGAEAPDVPGKPAASSPQQPPALGGGGGASPTGLDTRSAPSQPPIAREDLLGDSGVQQSDATSVAPRPMVERPTIGARAVASVQEQTSKPPLFSAVPPEQQAGLPQLDPRWEKMVTDYRTKGGDVPGPESSEAQRASFMEGVIEGQLSELNSRRDALVSAVHEANIAGVSEEDAAMYQAEQKELDAMAEYLSRKLTQADIHKWKDPDVQHRTKVRLAADERWKRSQQLMAAGQMTHPEVIREQIVAPVSRAILSVGGNTGAVLARAAASGAPQGTTAQVALDEAAGWFGEGLRDLEARRPTEATKSLSAQNVLPKFAEAATYMGFLAAAAPSGAPAMIATGMLASGDDYYREAIDAGMKPDQAEAFSLVMSGTESAVELVNPGPFFNSGVRKELAKKALKSMASGEAIEGSARSVIGKYMAEQAGAEGAEEAVTYVAQNAVSRGANAITGSELNTEISGAEMAESAFLGAALGGLMAGIGKLSQRPVYKEGVRWAVENEPVFMEYLNATVPEAQRAPILERYEKYKSIYKGIPPAVPKEAATTIAAAVAEKERIKEEQGKTTIDETVAAALGNQFDDQAKEQDDIIASALGIDLVELARVQEAKRLQEQYDKQKLKSEITKTPMPEGAVRPEVPTITPKVEETVEGAVSPEGKKGEEPAPVQPTGDEVQEVSLIAPATEQATAEGSAVTQPEVVTETPIEETAAEEAPDYRMEHRPTEDGAPAYDLLEGGLIPDDVYDRPDDYSGFPKVARETIRVLKSVRGNPDAEITVYRSGPKNTLNPGDWISLSRSYAKDEGLDPKDPSKDMPVHSFKVKAKDVRWAMDDLAEFGYFPQPQQPTVVEDVSIVANDAVSAPTTAIEPSGVGPSVEKVAEAPPEVPPQAPPSVSVPAEVAKPDLYVKPDLSRDVSDDPVALASAYLDEHMAQNDGSSLDDQIGTLVSNNISAESFKMFGDVNKITKDMKRAYLRESGGRTLDDLAQELSGDGNEVTPQDIVEYVLRNPAGRSATTPRSREIADRYYGITGKRMNSMVAKSILKGKNVKWKPEEQAIVDEAQAAGVDLSEIDDQDVNEFKEMSDEDADLFFGSPDVKKTVAQRKLDADASRAKAEEQVQRERAAPAAREVRGAESASAPRAADLEEERLAEVLKTARAERDKFVNDFNNRGQGLFAPADIPTKQSTIDDTIDNSKENFDAKVEPLNERVRQATKALADYVGKAAARAEAASKQTRVDEAPAPEPSTRAQLDAIDKAYRSASRFKPNKRVEFGSPITGPSGAKLTAYEWKYKFEEYVDSRGEDRVKRVSDWDMAELSDETGRDIVHQFEVVDKNGRGSLVSAESALKIMGYMGGAQGKDAKSMMSAAKTLAGYLMQLDGLRAELQIEKDAKAKVASMPRPEVVVKKGSSEALGLAKQRKNETWSMGDAEVWVMYPEDGTLSNDERSERLKTVEWSWEQSELKKLGVNPYARTEQKIAELERKIATKERQLGGKVKDAPTRAAQAPATAEAPLPKKEKATPVTKITEVSKSPTEVEYKIPGWEDKKTVARKEKGGWSMWIEENGVSFKIQPDGKEQGNAILAAHDAAERMNRHGREKVQGFIDKASAESASIADRIEQAADELEKKLRGMTGAFPVPPTIIVSAMRAAAKVVRAGESLAKAIRAAIDDMQASKWWKALSPSDQGKAEREVREQLRVALQPREPKAPKPSEVKKAVQQSTGTKPEKKIVEVDESKALRDQIRLEIRAAVEGGKEVAKKVAAVMDKYKTKLSPAQVTTLTRAAARAVTPAAARRFAEYADKIISNSENAAKEKEVRDLTKRIKRMLRGNADERRDAMVNDLAGRFARLNIANVDIDEHLEKATRLFETLSSPKAKSTPEVVTAKDTETNISNAELASYINQQEAVDRAAAERDVLEEYEAMRDELGAENADLTPDELKVIIDAMMGEKEQQEAAERLMQIREKVKMLRTMARIKMQEIARYEKFRAISENPFSAEERKMLDDLKEIDIDRLSGDEAAFLITAANNIIVNNRWGGVRDFAAKGRAERGINEATKALAPLKRIGRPGDEQKDFPIFNNTDTNEILAEKIARGPTAAAKFMQAIGMHEWLASISAAKRELDTVLRRRNEAAKELGFKQHVDDSVLNRYKMGFYAYLIQHKGGSKQDIQAQFDQRAENVRESVRRMENPNKFDQFNRNAELYIQAANDVLGDAKSIDDLNISPKLKGMVLHQIGEYQRGKESTFNSAEYDHNKIPDAYSNYTRQRSMAVTDEAKADEQKDLFEAPMWGNRLIDSRPSSSKMDRSDMLLPGHAINADFFSVQDQSFFETVADNLGAQHLATLREVLNDPRTLEMLGASTRNLLRDRVRSIKGLEQTKTDLLTGITGNWYHTIAKRSMGIALKGVLQMPKQATVAISTYVGLGKDANLMWQSYADAAKAFTDQEGSWQYQLVKDEQIHERAKTLGGLEKLGDSIAKKAVIRGDEGDVGRVMKVLAHDWGVATDKLLVPLSASDAISAQAAWFAFYKKKLKQKGVDLRAEGWKHQKDSEAAAYANQMTSRQQNANAVESMAQIYREKGSGRIIVDMLFSYSSFALNAKKRMARDIQTLRTGAKEDKAYAARDLAGLTIETMAFSAMTYWISMLGKGLADKLVDAAFGGDGDDDDLSTEEWLTDVLSKGAFELLFGGLPEVASNSIKSGINPAAEEVAELFGTKVRKGGKDLFYVPYGWGAGSGRYGAVIDELTHATKGWGNIDRPEGATLGMLALFSMLGLSDQTFTRPMERELYKRLGKKKKKGRSRPPSH